MGRLCFAVAIAVPTLTLGTLLIAGCRTSGGISTFFFLWRLLSLFSGTDRMPVWILAGQEAEISSCVCDASWIILLQVWCAWMGPLLLHEEMVCILVALSHMWSLTCCCGVFMQGGVVIWTLVRSSTILRQISSDAGLEVAISPTVWASAIFRSQKVHVFAAIPVLGYLIATQSVNRGFGLFLLVMSGPSFFYAGCFLLLSLLQSVMEFWEATRSLVSAGSSPRKEFCVAASILGLFFGPQIFSVSHHLGYMVTLFLAFGLSLHQIAEFLMYRHNIAYRFAPVESGLASTELPVEEEVSGQNADREAQSTFDPVKKRPIWTVLRRNKQKKYTLIGALKRLIVLGLCFFSLFLLVAILQHHLLEVDPYIDSARMELKGSSERLVLDHPRCAAEFFTAEAVSAPSGMMSSSTLTKAPQFCDLTMAGGKINFVELAKLVHLTYIGWRTPSGRTFRSFFGLAGHWRLIAESPSPHTQTEGEPGGDVDTTVVGMEENVGFLHMYHPEKKLHVVAVRGTVSSKLMDWVQDFDVWLEPAVMKLFTIVAPGFTLLPRSIIPKIVKLFSHYLDGMHTLKNRFYHEAVRTYIVDLQQKISSSDTIIMTGHSLGAGIASVVGSLQNLEVAAFSGPGIEEIHEKFGVPEDRLHNLLVNLYGTNDLVPLIGTHTGLTSQFLCHHGDPVACHLTVNLLCHLQSLCPRFSSTTTTNSTSVHCSFRVKELSLAPRWTATP